MTTTKTIAIAAIAIITFSVSSSSANAQGFGYQQYNNQGSNYGHRDNIDFQYERSLTHQNPRAAAVGGILQGIAAGLNASDPKKNATASGIIGGIGNGIYGASGAHEFQRGSIQRQQQGYQNSWQNRGASIQRQPFYSNGSMGQMGQGMGHGHMGQSQIHRVGRPVYHPQPGMGMGRPGFQPSMGMGRPGMTYTGGYRR